MSEEAQGQDPLADIRGCECEGCRLYRRLYPPEERSTG